MTSTTNVAEITLTEAAANAVKDLLSQKKLNEHGLRVYIAGSGCQGYQYGMALEKEPKASDAVMEQHGVKIIIDDVSAVYLQGATIDYVETEMESGFKIDNPNSMSSCGCGSTGDQTSSSGCGCGC